MQPSSPFPYRRSLVSAFVKAFLVYTALQLLMATDDFARGWEDVRSRDSASVGRLP